MPLTRRQVIGRATAAALGAAVAPAMFDRALVGGVPNVVGNGRYGPLGGPDANGLRLPSGFRSRLLATVGTPVAGTTLVWRANPDGGACFAAAGDGWIYVANHEIDGGRGGTSAIRFDGTGRIVDAYSILSGTSMNCNGGPTPWGTYLSCEEHGDVGQVYECDPARPGDGVVRTALGSFNHEAAAVDPATGDVYLTEDRLAGRLYRFVPTVPGRLDAGQLFAAVVDLDGISSGPAPVGWQPADPSVPDRSATTAAFRGGEGAWVHGRRLLFTTKIDKRVWELDLHGRLLRVVHDCLAQPERSLDDVDAIAVHERTGDIYVAEDPGNMELAVIEERPGGVVAVSPFAQFVGHVGSEVTGVAFDPRGDRLYLSSQRGVDNAGVGITLEVVGPFVGSGSRFVDIGTLAPATRLGP